jgi:hypothetical protein
MILINHNSLRHWLPRYVALPNEVCIIMIDLTHWRPEWDGR